jgi:hypothetical protein
MLLPAVVAGPFLWLGVPLVLVYNLALLATFVLAGTAMYVLVRALTGQAPAALVAGVIFAFYPFRFEHYSHFELLWCFWMPLALLALHRTVAFGRLRNGALTGAALAAQAYSCMYFGVFLAVYLVPVWAVIAVGWHRVRRGLGPLVLGTVLAGAALAPLTIPYVEARQVLVTYRPWHKVPQAERELFPGILAVTLALIALWPPLSVSRLGYGVGLLFAFEASLGFNGRLYPVLYRVIPFFHGLRVPARFSMLVGFSLAVLAGYGIARLTRPAGASVRWIITGLAVLIVSVETRNWLPAVPVEMAPDPIYAYFNGRPPAVLAELPTGIGRVGLDPDFRYLYASTFHWQRLLNGMSGFTPRSYDEFASATARFPDDRAMALIVSRHVDYVAIHEEFWGRARFQSVAMRAAERADLREVARSQHNGFESRLYQIVR